MKERNILLPTELKHLYFQLDTGCPKLNLTIANNLVIKPIMKNFIKIEEWQNNMIGWHVGLFYQEFVHHSFHSPLRELRTPHVAETSYM